MTTTRQENADAFRAFEHGAWQNVVKPYVDIFGSLTTQCTGPLLDAIGATRSTRLLDVASGPGYVAAAAAQRGANVVGLDFSSAMVAEAAARHSNVEFREGDAQNLPFPDESFDAVVISFGMLHFPDPDRALEEAYRVLRRGGRIGFTVWAAPEKALGFGLVVNAIQTHGNTNIDLPQGPPFFRFSDPAESSRTLTSAGFVEPRITEVAQTWRFSSPEEWIAGIERSTVRTAATLRAQTPEALSKIHEALQRAAQPFRSSDGTIALPMPAVLSTATKP